MNLENVITVTTDSNGRAKFDRLELGIYTITEIKVRMGILLRVM